MHKAFFLDRDGTINVDYDFVHRPEEWTWCDGAIDALRWMKKEGFKIIVVTNQSGISRGLFTEDHVHELHLWVDEVLRTYDLSVDGWYVAPYHPDYQRGDSIMYEPSDRKPGTGMFLRAAAKHNIDFSRSFMAGDKITDLKPAVELRMEPFFIRSRHEPDQDRSWLMRHNIDTFDTLKQVTDSL